MANTIVTLEDLLACEARVLAFLDRRIRQMEEKPQPLFYSPAEVAEMVGLTVHAIRHRLRDPNEQHLKGIQANGVGASWLIPRESVDAFVSRLKRNR